MAILLLFTLLFTKDTIITTLAPGVFIRPAATPYRNLSTPTNNLSTPTTNPVILHLLNASDIPLKNVILDWSIQTDGAITKTGKSPLPLLTPNKQVPFRTGLHMPNDTMGETFLLLHYRSATTTLANQQILLRPWLPRLTIKPAGELTLSDENDIVTIRSPAIRISFNRQTGWLVHYEIKDIDLLDDTSGLRPNFWESGRYNDSAHVDSGWLAATREPHLQLFSNTTTSEQITIRTEYTLPATASLLHLSYVVNATGEMLITQQVEPDTTQPPTRDSRMPCFGMKWVLPPGFDSITRYGPLGSGDPIHPHIPLPSGRIGISHEAATIDTGPDPRAAANRTDVRWWTITDRNGNGLQFIADTPLLNECTVGRQISIERPATLSPDGWPDPLPIGNYQYAYKVKPLVTSTRH